MSFFKQAEKPFLIAGPCSAETREQVLATAEGIKDLPVKLFRAGVWKPRTRPGHFEGIGERALEWLSEVRLLYGMKVVTEIAEPVHAELALKHNIDAVWIGARTTVNPFDVQRIADALKGTKIPVLIKNPVSPDIDLWLGAIERMEQAGIEDIAAIHRGFSIYKASSEYRNPPNWPIPIELRRRRPDVPIICDPSHITGKRSLVADVAQKAMDMGFEGLMIETHPSPDQARTDAAQQVTPAALKELLAGLVIRSKDSIAHNAELDYLRQLMDSLDAEVIDLIARRMELSKRMGIVKKESGMTAYQADRWREIVQTRGHHALSKHLSEEFIVDLFQKIHHQSVKLQLQILQQDGEH